MRTKKKDRLIVELNNQIINKPNPKITEWLLSNFKPIGLGIKNSIVCTECGHKFDAQSKQDGFAVCPHCGKSLKIERTRASRKKYFKGDFFMVSHVYRNHQVFRFYWVKKSAHIQEDGSWKIDNSVENCMNRWIAPDGNVVWLRRRLCMFPNTARNPFSMSPEMFVANPNTGYYSSFNLTALGYANLKVRSLAKWLRYRGLNGRIKNGKFNGLWFDDLCEDVMKNYISEILVKRKKYQLLEEFHRAGFFDNRHFSENCESLKIALRHKYFDSELFKGDAIKDNVGFWIDLLGQLRFLGKDLHSPHYICPDNLIELHNKLTEKIEAVNLEKNKERMAKDQKEYAEKMKRFFGLEFVDGDMRIKPLPSVADFYKEGNKMHHCVYSNKYYNKENCLILSARIGESWNKPEKWAETIEVNLKNYEIVQSRGVCNSQSEYHEKVVSLMERNMEEIKKCNEMAV